ncbi:BatD family protein [Microbulbifer sp. CAU 1566]|uniref:BatD family protein n=1 Tax=Microbulbifer sp. CAU 1566 TaxID=2933269 RepID=UPI002002F786|nr:BatD family protein [Microbulbifer sp. CAU 1566]MCK7597665.1 BatD family protein [Microbulbifer sp. CAU 1566]
MKRWLLCFILGLLCGAQAAAADKPIIKYKLSEEKAVPGQSISLFVTILVPTWMTQPPDFPEFDQPNLSVTLPGRSSQAISQVIDGNTWSGVAREYLIIPLAPGTYRLPAGQVKLAYKNPDDGDDLQATLKLAPPPIEVTTPEGAAGLNPFIAARELTLSQEIEGEPEALHAGDAFSRNVTATIEGSTVMFIPQLLDSRAPEGLAAYPDTHKAEDKTDPRTDETTGTRNERMTYVAESGVRGTLPAITLRWYDLDDGQIKTSSVDAIKVHARGPGAFSGTSLWEKLLILAGAALLFWLLWQWAVPRIHQFQSERTKRAEASGLAAWQRLYSACNAQDYSAVLQAAGEYRRRAPSAAQSLQPALFTLGAIQYGDTPASVSSAAAWQQLTQAIEALRPDAAHIRQAPLPPLNP